MRALAALAAIAWLAIYLPDTGRGFIKDDFAWLLAAPLASSPWDAAWTASTGFFRPLVSLSFTLNHALFGLHSFGYGLTNLLLALGCACAVYALARSWRLEKAAAVLAAFMWLFTPHGMDMAVIWISGRSALLLVLFAVSACACFARGQRVAALALTALALLSKDEAVMLPLLLAVSALAAGRFDRRRDTAALAASIGLVAAYLWMRAASGAHSPWNAPADYRPVLEARHLIDNVMQYADRTLSFAVALVFLAWIISRRRDRAPVAMHGAIYGLPWVAIALLPVMALPVRSSLYVLLPLAGSCIAAAHLIERWLMAVGPPRRKLAFAMAVVLLVTLVPFHRSRQREWSGAARLSAGISASAAQALRDVPEGTRVIVRDRFEQPNLESTFGNLLPEMLLIGTGKRYELVTVPPGPSISLTPVPR